MNAIGADRFVRQVLLLLVLLLLPVTATLAAAGRILFAVGEVTLVRVGDSPIAKGMSIEAGDLIVTGADGRVQMLMVNG